LQENSLYGKLEWEAIAPRDCEYRTKNKEMIGMRNMGKWLVWSLAFCLSPTITGCGSGVRTAVGDRESNDTGTSDSPSFTVAAWRANCTAAQIGAVRIDELFDQAVKFKNDGEDWAVVDGNAEQSCDDYCTNYSIEDTACLDDCTVCLRHIIFNAYYAAGGWVFYSWP